MSAIISLPEPDGASGRYFANEDVRRCVQHQEWLESIVPRTVFWAVLGTALLMILMRYHWHVTGGVLVAGAIALVIARVAVALVVGILVSPTRNLRFRLAAKKLGSRLSAADLTI